MSRVNLIQEGCHKLIEKIPFLINQNSSFVVMNLKCKNVSGWDNRSIERRFVFTKKFIEENVNGFADNRVLDIGGENGTIFGRNMAKELEFEYNHTEGDMNYHIWQPSDVFDVIFCFEILEHLMNPLLFLEQLKNRCNKDTDIFITFPNNPLWLWGDRHFNEYTKNRFYTLISEAGYKIEAYEWDKAYLRWRTIFTGIRPIIRYFVKMLGLSRDMFYYVRLK